MRYKQDKKHVGAITFHSSYNHGSVLQAYALQEYILKKYGDYFDYEIINLRTKRQKDYYNKPFGFYDLKSIVKQIVFFKYKKQILKSNDNYEAFIAKYLHLTKEYSSLEELKKANLRYDYYISGSDQIWNYPILDFDWAYFLEFCENGKKVSYAASLGPNVLNGASDDAERIKKDIGEYSNVSVREQGSLETLVKLTGRKDIEINIDPTLLLSSDEWNGLIGKRIIDGDYIFLYDLKAKKESFDTAKIISEKYKLPIIVVKNEYLIDRKYKNIVRRYDAGPLEFLNYIKYAKIVVSSSFHGNVFSIIFNKPFIAVGGKKDLRIINLLKMVKLEKCATDDLPDAKNILEAIRVGGRYDHSGIECERRKADAYLRKALDLEENCK